MGGAGTRAIFDTNILIDYLRGFAEAQSEIEQASFRAISVVSWIEVMAGIHPRVEEETRRVLGSFELIGMTTAVVEQTVIVRRERRLKLPDAIILATAIAEGLLLVTRNTRDFQEEAGVVRIPYRI